MSYETLIWEQSGGSGRLTLNRPDSLNSWTTELGHELRQVLEGEAADASVRAVMITGAGRGFSSGADLKSGFEPHPDDGRPNLRKELDEIYHPVITAVRELPKPIVAAVNGPAVGIGASLAFACDLVLAAESAYFGLAFVNIGLMPDGGSTALVPAAVGKARAFQMALLGERVPAQTALDWGLINQVHPDDKLMDEATWSKQQDNWLPSKEDGDFIQSLMKQVVEPGKFASWIAPPRVGIDNKPGDFEYVKIAA